MQSDKPLQITMPPSRKSEERKAGDGKGRWIDVEEEIRTDSGTVITVKTRKWQPGSRRGTKSSLEEGLKGAKAKAQKGDRRDEYPDDLSVTSQGGTIAVTDRGIFIFNSGAIGKVQPPDPLDRQLAPADNPDIWARHRFDCHTLYDHELYTRCQTQDEVDVNQHHIRPRKVVRQYLDSISRASTSEEDKPEWGQNFDSSPPPHSDDEAQSVAQSVDAEGSEGQVEVTNSTNDL
ncbi:hypothetical protein ElyMa_006051700 [Elysia marginata]|uniref:Uncharacterized protein n=1 Tax=Elysia marginata TaxID=1093978 RepID=A0AAV4GL02_9GAST|nr:hypothetical protein ElyMa_006051700 [Elysia marginata]